MAPHRRPPKEVTGKVTGEPSHVENHRALDTDRAVAPYRRDPTIAGKVTLSTHPAYRSQTPSALYGRPAGATSRDLAEHEGQSLFVATESDVRRTVAKSGAHRKFQTANAITNDGMVGEPPMHKKGWEAAVRDHRAFDGAYGATTLEFNTQTAPNELGKQRVVKGREAHEPQVGSVVFGESPARREELRRAAEANGGGGGGAYRHTAAFSGAAGLDSSDHTTVRNRERWQRSEGKTVKGVGMQPAEVFHPGGGVVFGGRGESGGGSPARGRDGQQRDGQQRDAARREAYYDKFQHGPGGAAAGVKTMHQSGLSTASEGVMMQSRAGGPSGAPIVAETNSVLGHSIKAVRSDAFDGAHGSTTTMINSQLPELKSSLTADGAIAQSAESLAAAEAGVRAESRRARFTPDTPEVVFGESPRPIRKVDEVRELDARAGADTHLVNRRELNTRYHDRGRYGRFGKGATAEVDASVATVGEFLFSRPRVADLARGQEAGVLDAMRGADRRVKGAAGMSSSAVAEVEPLMRYRAYPDQTVRQRQTSEKSEQRSRELHFAPQVEDVVFDGTNVSTLQRPGVRGELYAHRDGGREAPVQLERARAAAAGGGRGAPRPSSPRGGAARAASPGGGGDGGGPRYAWGTAASGGKAGASSAPRNTGTTNAAGTTTHELSQKDQSFGGPGGPDHVVRGVRSGLPHQVSPTRGEASEVVQARGSRHAPDQTTQLRSQPAFTRAAGASTQEVESQMSLLPAERRAASPGGGQRAASPGARVRPTPQLFERSLSSPRSSSRGPAGLTTGKIAAAEPYFLTDLDAGVKMGATHPSRFGEVVFHKRAPPAQRKYGDVELQDAPEFRGRLGIPSHKYGARDPLLVGDCPPGTESAAASTWKSQVDEVLYGKDLDGSGDYTKMNADIVSAPQYRGAAGLSSLANANDAPEMSVDVNTRIDTTYAEEAGVPARVRSPGEPIREPIKPKRAKSPFQPPELFSKAGVSGWMNQPRAPGLAAGKDELWRPCTALR